MSKTKIGILGGTFDPIHMGHLIVAEDIRQKMGLGEVLFIPAGRPWLKIKERKPVSQAEHRLAMVKLAIASNPCFKVSTIEIDRLGLSYSIDTVLELKAKLGAGAEIYFIVGPDALAEFSLVERAGPAGGDMPGGGDRPSWPCAARFALPGGICPWSLQAYHVN